MKASMLRAVSLVFALALTSCLSPRMMSIVVPPQVDGPHSSELTKHDIREILDLSLSRSDIRQPIYRIYVEAPDRADVSGGRPRDTGDVATLFKVRKKDGHWIIIKGSISEGPIIITS